MKLILLCLARECLVIKMYSWSLYIIAQFLLFPPFPLYLESTSSTPPCLCCVSQNASYDGTPTSCTRNSNYLSWRLWTLPASSNWTTATTSTATNETHSTSTRRSRLKRHVSKHGRECYPICSRSQWWRRQCCYHSFIEYDRLLNKM